MGYTGSRTGQSVFEGKTQTLAKLGEQNRSVFLERNTRVGRGPATPNSSDTKVCFKKQELANSGSLLQ